MRHILVFYVTHPNKDHAQQLVKQLMDERLIACGNIFPISSDYIWKGSACQEDEFVSILKTQSSHEKKVEERIEQLHEYDTPCIMRIDFRCNATYASWIDEQTKS